MDKKIIILLTICIILFVLVILGIIFINKNITEGFDMSAKKQLANIEDKNLEFITTLANQNAISPNNVKEEIEEFILKENAGYIAIYKIDKDKNEVLIKTTDIVVMYLPDLDKKELENGIKIVGKDSLNSRLEDYE